jgi:hypothetical protein
MQAILAGRFTLSATASGPVPPGAPTARRRARRCDGTALLPIPAAPH